MAATACRSAPATRSKRWDPRVLLGLATIALVTLPYATERPVAIDRGLSYVAVALVGWTGLALRAFDLFTVGALGLPTTRGLWLAAVGLIVLSRAAYEIAGERRER